MRMVAMMSAMRTARMLISVALLSAMAAFVAGCGGGGGSDSETSGGPLFVSLSYGTMTGWVGEPMSGTPDDAPAVGGTHFTATGLPAGLSINASTGAISGTPTQA